MTPFNEPMRAVPRSQWRPFFARLVNDHRGETVRLLLRPNLKSPPRKLADNQSLVNATTWHPAEETPKAASPQLIVATADSATKALSHHVLLTPEEVLEGETMVAVGAKDGQVMELRFGGGDGPAASVRSRKVS